jgi:tetratricopeptide (TPR) repeat protein
MTIIVDAQSIEKKAPADYLKLPPSEENVELKIAITEILKENIEIEDINSQQVGSPSDIEVYDDRIEFRIKNKSEILFFYELLNESFTMIQPKIKYYFKAANFKFYGRNLGSKNIEGFNQLSRYFTSVKNQIKNCQYDYQLIQFEPIAVKYLSLEVKPTVSEVQRKYIVQANSFNERKLYANAIEFYEKAIEVNQTAYPAAYTNLALLSAQIQNFDAAIYYMKKYLLLEPESSDARSSQDKIYEWEAQ